MKTFTTLYKRRSDGSVHTWCMEQEGDKHRSVAGLVDGKKVTSTWTICEPKNVGRSNATTGEEQALAEIEAKYTKQRKRGYMETVDAVDNDRGFFEPMLCDKFDISKIENKNVFSQPKLDGLRCLAQADRLQSRSGKKDFVTCPHIRQALKSLFEIYPEVVLDGELYNHDLHDDFPKIVSLVKKQKPTEADILEASEKVQYWIYDCYHPDYPDLTFTERQEFLSVCFEQFIDDTRIMNVPTVETAEIDVVDELFAKYMEDGYEGQIIRFDARYENTRSKNILKRKEFDDEEFKIIAIEEGKGNRSGIAGFVHYHLGDGSDRTFRSGIKGSHDYCRTLLAEAEKYKGGTGTVRFFRRSPDGIPRFPVTVMVYEGDRDT